MARPPKPRSRPPAPRLPKGLPDKAALLAFLRGEGESGKADIARHFGLKGADRVIIWDDGSVTDQQGNVLGNVYDEIA